MRRLKAVKDLSVLIVAPRRHDRKLWADLLKNCGINHPTAMDDIKQAAHFIGSGQADVVFVDEAYGAQGIAKVLIPARGVEFSGGRGVCLILCSKKATAADVLNARRLGFASLVILPASSDTVRKHLELAARYIPPSDEELGWSAPKPKEEKDRPAMPDAREDGQALSVSDGMAQALDSAASQHNQQSRSPFKSGANHDQDAGDVPSLTLVKSGQSFNQESKKSAEDLLDKAWEEEESASEADDFTGQTPGRSASSAAEEEVVFL